MRCSVFIETEPTVNTQYAFTAPQERFRCSHIQFAVRFRFILLPQEASATLQLDAARLTPLSVYVQMYVLCKCFVICCQLCIHSHNMKPHSIHTFEGEVGTVSKTNHRPHVRIYKFKIIFDKSHRGYENRLIPLLRVLIVMCPRR